MQDGSSVNVLENSSKKDTSGDQFIRKLILSSIYISDVIICSLDDNNTPDLPTDNQDTKGNCY